MHQRGPAHVPAAVRAREPRAAPGRRDRQRRLHSRRYRGRNRYVRYDATGRRVRARRRHVPAGTLARGRKRDDNLPRARVGPDVFDGPLKLSGQEHCADGAGQGALRGELVGIFVMWCSVCALPGLFSLTASFLGTAVAELRFHHHQPFQCHVDKVQRDLYPEEHDATSISAKGEGVLSFRQCSLLAGV